MRVYDQLREFLGDTGFWSTVPSGELLTDSFEVRETLTTRNISQQLGRYGWTQTEEYPHCWTTKVTSNGGEIYDVYLYFHPIQPTYEGKTVFGLPTEGLKIYAKKEVITDPYFAENYLVCRVTFTKMTD